MAPSKPRTKPPAERRDDLMNAAERLFLEQGFEQTTVEDITTAADVAKGTFYLQFASKTEILDALRQRFVQAMAETVTAAVESCKAGDFEGRLAGWARSCAVFYIDAARLHHLVFVVAPPPSREGMTRNVLIDSLEAVLTAGVENQAWSLDDAHLTAVLLFNALHGAVNEPISDNPETREKLLAAIITHFFRAVGVEG
jgi:AcrR family transcriptional regulator